MRESKTTTAITPNEFAPAALLRRALRNYVRHFPYHRGKDRLIRAFHRLMPATGSRHIVQTDRNLWMELDLNEFIQRAIYYYGTYESGNLALFRQQLAPGMIVADCGANVGLFTLVAASVVAGSGEVHAFEPTPATYLALQRNIELNHFTCVSPNRLALADNNDLGRPFYVSQLGNQGSNSFAATGPGLELAQFEVPVTTLDEYFSARNCVPDFIKLDVEGAELLVLRGSARILRDRHPALLLEADEQNFRPFGYTVDMLAQFLRNYDYDIATVNLAGNLSRKLETTRRFPTLFCQHRRS